ncbi:MAG: orotidine-5'-phosphate decarboxylase [Chloroflexi bacterium]|nr:orotidine-5'-phosphate decarboxylase [Chloroflexota bacterium]
MLVAAQRSRSLLCVGLDPDPAQMALPDVAEFNRAIIEATSDLVCAYKPNLAFYEALGVPGLLALEKTLQHIPSHIVTIGDAKRGDVQPSSRFYARAMFDRWGFDAVTVIPYLGSDSLEPFLERPEKGVFVLCRTSNPGAREFQDLELTGLEWERRPLFEFVALRAAAWDTHGNVGLVVGATYPEEIKHLRELCPDMPLLIPGVGAQGGALETAVRYGVDRNGRRAIINASRSVLYASRDRASFAEAARREALRVRDLINETLQREGKPWPR